MNDRKLKILHIYSGNLWGGIESQLKAMAMHQKEVPLLHQEFALCFTGRLSSELASLGFKPHTLGPIKWSRPWSIRFGQNALIKLLRNSNYDAVICHSAWSLAIFGSSISKLSIPLIFWLHDAFHGKHWLERLTLNTIPTLIICNSAYTKKTVDRFFANSTFRIIHCPVHLTSKKETPPIRESLRNQLGISNTDVALIQVGRLTRSKGLHLLIAALGMLKSLDHWKALIVGGPQKNEEQEYLTELKELANTLGIEDRIHFLGQRSDVNELLTCSDLFIQVNTSPEPFGIAFIEALTLGLPVIGSRSGGVEEIVTPEVGILLERPDATLLAQSLETLVKDPKQRQALSLGGPARAQSLSNPKAQLEKTRTAILEILS